MRTPWNTGALVAAAGCLVGCLVGVPAVAQAPPSVDWPTAGYDSSRSGDNPNESVLSRSTVGTLHPVWTTSIDGSTIVAQPILAANVPTAWGNRDLLFVGTEHGTTAAVDAASGAILWERGSGYNHVACTDYPNGDFGISAPAAFDRAGNAVYSMGGDGKLYAYAPGTGATLPGWPVTITTTPWLEHVYSGLNVANGSVYVATASMCDEGTYHGRVVQVSTSTATVVNRLYMDGSLADVNGNIYQAGSGGGGIWGAGGVTTDATGHYVYAASGNLVGAGNESSAYGNHVVRMLPNLDVVNAATPNSPCVGCDTDLSSAPILFEPAGCDATLAVLSKNENLYVYRRHPFVDTPAATLPVDAFVGQPAYDVPTQTLVMANNSGVLAWRFDANCNPNVAWNTAIPSAPAGQAGYVVTPAAIANGVVYYGDGLGQILYAMDLNSGQLLWSWWFGKTFYSQPTVVNGSMFVSTWDGQIIALRP